MWFKTVNDIQREGICNELRNLLARAVQGEEDVKEQLGVDNLMKLSIKARRDVPHKSSLKVMACWATELCKCSLYVKDDVLKCIWHAMAS